MCSDPVECRNQEKFADENRQAESIITAGNFSDAAAMLTEIVQKDPENWRAYNSFGMICWAQSRWVDAFTMFKKSVAMRIDYADALSNLFDAALKLRKVNEIVPILELALMRNQAMADIKLIYDTILQHKDEIYRCDRALEVGIYSPILEEAKTELEAGNHVKAMDLFLKSNDQEGPSAPAYCGLGICSVYQNRPEDAYQLFVESIKLNPTDTDCFLNLLDAASACGKREQAKGIFNLCRKNYPKLEKIAAEFAF